LEAFSVAVLLGELRVEFFLSGEHRDAGPFARLSCLNTFTVA
jgi:hypothetical protein